MNFTIRVTNVQELLKLARFLGEECPDASLVSAHKDGYNDYVLSDVIMTFKNVHNEKNKILIEL